MATRKRKRDEKIKEVEDKRQKAEERRLKAEERRQQVEQRKKAVLDRKHAAAVRREEKKREKDQRAKLKSSKEAEPPRGAASALSVPHIEVQRASVAQPSNDVIQSTASALTTVQAPVPDASHAIGSQRHSRMMTLKAEKSVVGEMLSRNPTTRSNRSIVIAHAQIVSDVPGGAFLSDESDREDQNNEKIELDEVVSAVEDTGHHGLQDAGGICAASHSNERNAVDALVQLGCADSVVEDKGARDGEGATEGAGGRWEEYVDESVGSQSVLEDKNFTIFKRRWVPK